MIPHVDFITTKYYDVNDNRVLWDLIRYGVRRFSIKYCKEKARERRNRLAETEQKIHEYGIGCSVDSQK